MIDDPHDRGIHRRALATEGLAGGTPLHDDQDLLVYTRANRIDGEQRRATSRVIERQWLDEQQLGATECSVFLGCDDCAYYTRQLQFGPSDL